MNMFAIVCLPFPPANLQRLLRHLVASAIWTIQCSFHDLFYSPWSTAHSTKKKGHPQTPVGFCLLLIEVNHTSTFYHTTSLSFKMPFLWIWRCAVDASGLLYKMRHFHWSILCIESCYRIAGSSSHPFGQASIGLWSWCEWGRAEIAL